MKLKVKLIKIVDGACADADTYGDKTIHTCNMLGYGWDRDIWNYRDTIIKAIKNRGYNVDVSVNWGVTDITITPKISI